MERCEPLEVVHSACYNTEKLLRLILTRKQEIHTCVVSQSVYISNSYRVDIVTVRTKAYLQFEAKSR